MITCDHVIASLGEFVAGGLSSEEHAELEWHLALCPMCFEDVDAYRAVICLADTLPTPALSAEAELRIRNLLTAAAKIAREAHRTAG